MEKLYIHASTGAVVPVDPTVMQAIIAAARNTMLKRPNDLIDHEAAVVMSEVEQNLLGTGVPCV